MAESGRASTWRELRQLLKLPGFRKLFAVRLASQTADGMFQVGLATLLFFSPTSLGTAAGVATGFAVMLAPFTIVGPFAGVLLDRWYRRQILLFGNLLRALLTLIMAVLFFRHAGVLGVEILGLAALSVNRFLLAGLSAGMPKVIADDAPPEVGDPKTLLLTANSLVPTIGAGAAFLGGALGLLLSNLGLPGVVAGDYAAIAGSLNSAITLFGAAATMLIAALLASRLTISQLGPEVKLGETFRQGISRVAKDLAGAARYLKFRVTPFQALAVTTIHRFIYGLVFISAILMSRNILANPSFNLTVAPAYLPEGSNYGDAGLGYFAIIMGLIGVGGGLAVIITPLLSRSMGPHKWIALMLLLDTSSLLILATTPRRLVIYAAALLLGMGSQGSKIAIDTIVHRDTDDHFRGRAFAFYDVIFNGAFVGAALLAAFIVPDIGWSRPLFLGLALVYLTVATLVYVKAARFPPE